MAATNAKKDEGNGPVFGTWFDSDSTLGSLQEENRSLRIKIAGVDTLSSLLRGTRDELETICAEKESLEMEVSRLQCRCVLLEKDLATTKDNAQITTGQSKSMFDALLKENKKLKNELKHSKTDGNSKESMFGANAMCELLAFKGELENEITHLQKAICTHEEESSIPQIARLLGQVTKLEYQLKTKEEECIELRREIDMLNAQSENDTVVTSNDVCRKKENRSLVQESAVDIAIQASARANNASTQTEASADHHSMPQEAGTDDSKLKGSQTQEVILRKKTNSMRRRSSRHASGDWTNIRKVYSELFDDEWNLDAINTSEQLKVTQDLLIQANEIILTMTEENEKLLKANAILLQDVAQGEDIQLSDKQKVLDRFKFLFSENSFEDYSNLEELQDILITGDLNAVDFGECSYTKDEVFGRRRLADCEQLNDNSQGKPDVVPTGDIQEVDKEKTVKNSSREGTIDDNSYEGKGKARDSGVEINPMEHEKQALFSMPENTQPIAVDYCKSSDSDHLVAENLRLIGEVELHIKKLAEADKKITHLEESLKLMKDEEIRWESSAVEKKADNRIERLSKSIGHIPSLARATTYRRVIIQSDV